MSSPNIPVIEVGHVRLILLHDETLHSTWISLWIPSDLCVQNLKYLRFLGSCILGVDGVLAYEPDGDEVDTDGNLSEHEIYYCNAEDEGTFPLTIPLLLYAQNTYDERFVNEDLAHAVDLEVIRDRSHVASETTSTRNNFRKNLLERDPTCVWLGRSSRLCSGMHIIPHKRGSEVRSSIQYWYYYLIVSLFFWQTSVATAYCRKSTKIR